MLSSFIRRMLYQVQCTTVILIYQTIADVIRTCLGPRAMLKMLMDPMGGICMTNDGNAILREITVQHPAAKSLIEIARTQDEEVGDGTTSVIILGMFMKCQHPVIMMYLFLIGSCHESLILFEAGEVLSVSDNCLGQNMHPTVIIGAYRQALEDMIDILKDQVRYSLFISCNDCVTVIASDFFRL